MLVKEFDYHLPKELIARFPADERDASRLMLLNRQSGTVGHAHFRNISSYLEPGDLLVLNDTRVIPARIFGCKSTGGKVEIFLIRRETSDSECWICLIRSSKGIREGQVISLAADMSAQVSKRVNAESWRVEFSGPEVFEVWLDREGKMPLPPYLQRAADSLDRERYQTVFAQTAGAVAAPTAGLHFTQHILTELSQKGVGIVSLTLHTGLGTFQPVRVERVQDHRIHTEYYNISEVTAEAIRTTRERGGRIVAVGTTTARTLEYAADSNGLVFAGAGEADIFIYPGYSFKVVDVLITNFHLPESTLIMLVSAFAGKDFVFDAYRQAVQSGYRFYSYGDAMLIV